MTKFKTIKNILKHRQADCLRRAQRDLKKLSEQEDLAALESEKPSDLPPTEDELIALRFHRKQLLAENARIASDKSQIIQRIHDDRENENKNRRHRMETGRVSPSAVSMDPRALEGDIEDIERRERETARQRMELETLVKQSQVKQSQAKQAQVKQSQARQPQVKQSPVEQQQFQTDSNMQREIKKIKSTSKSEKRGEKCKVQ